MDVLLWLQLLSRLVYSQGVSDFRDEHDERAARIDMILEEFRLNSEDLAELTRRAQEQALKMRAEARAMRDALRKSVPPGRKGTSG